MTIETLEQLVTEITGGKLTYNCDSYFCVKMQGHVFIVNKRPCTKSGRNYGSLYSDEKIREHLIERTAVIRKMISEG